MNRPITQRRICWPDPDATCLNGGCWYCNTHPYRHLTMIRKWASKAGVVPQRAAGSADALAAYDYGLENDFFNTDTR